MMAHGFAITSARPVSHTSLPITSWVQILKAFAPRALLPCHLTKAPALDPCVYYTLETIFPSIFDAVQSSAIENYATVSAQQRWDTIESSGPIKPELESQPAMSGWAGSVC